MTVVFKLFERLFALVFFQEFLAAFKLVYRLEIAHSGTLFQIAAGYYICRFSGLERHIYLLVGVTREHLIDYLDALFLTRGLIPLVD